MESRRFGMSRCTSSRIAGTCWRRRRRGGWWRCFWATRRHAARPPGQNDRRPAPPPAFGNGGLVVPADCDAPLEHLLPCYESNLCLM